MKVLPAKSSKTKILEAYLDLCFKKGAGHPTLQEIAKQARVAFGTVRYYFAGKGNPDIVSSAFEFVLAHSYSHHGIFMTSERTKVQGDQVDQFNPIHCYVRSMLFWIRENPKYASFLIYYYYLCTTSSGWRKERDLYFDTAYKRIESLLLEAIGRNIYRNGNLNVSNTITNIHNHILGSCIVLAIQNKSEIFESCLKNCLESVDSLILQTKKD